MNGGDKPAGWRLRVGYIVGYLCGSADDGLAYFTEPNNWRRVTHIISDAIYKRITGENGYFDTRIVYVAKGDLSPTGKTIGHYGSGRIERRYLTNGEALVLTPRFSPAAQESPISLISSNLPRVYLFNIGSGRQEILGNFEGMTFAPRFMPDGPIRHYVVREGGNSDIWMMDLRTRKSTRLTTHPAIDASPSGSRTSVYCLHSDHVGRHSSM